MATLVVNPFVLPNLDWALIEHERSNGTVLTLKTDNLLEDLTILVTETVL